MSARSRYLDAISPKSNTSENEFSTTQPNNQPSTNNSVGVNSSRGQQQQIISPSNLQNRSTNRSINNSSNSTNNYTNSSNNYTNTTNNNTNNNTNNTNNSSSNKTNNISTRNKLLASAPPPPPPPGPPPKRVGSNSRSQRTTFNITTNNSVSNSNNNNNNNRPVIKYTGDTSINNNQVVATVDNNESSTNNNPSTQPSPVTNQQDSVQPYSPAKKGGSIWSPKNEVQSGSVKSMTMKLWGSSKVNSPKVRVYYCVVDCVVYLDGARGDICGL